MPKVIQVIETKLCRGTGADDDHFHAVRQYHTLEGGFLAERDLDAAKPIPNVPDLPGNGASTQSEGERLEESYRAHTLLSQGMKYEASRKKANIRKYRQIEHKAFTLKSTVKRKRSLRAKLGHAKKNLKRSKTILEMGELASARYRKLMSEHKLVELPRTKPRKLPRGKR